MSGRKQPVGVDSMLCKPDPPAAPPRSRISDAEFMAAGLERYGRRFLEAIENIPARPAMWAPGAPAPSTGAACLAAGRQLAGYLEAERIAARTTVALDALEPRFPARRAVGFLLRTIERFQPSRIGLTIRPRD